MILPDYPIKDKDEDKLRRAPLAKKVAELIASFKGEESFVVGIEGVWGSGKTSFINLALREIKDDPNLIFINFNPWNFAGQNELITDFFNTLISKIEPIVSDKDKLKKVKSIVSKLTKKSELAISPEISAFWGAVNFRANDLLKFKVGEKTLEEERDDIDELFRTLGKKVVIIIDDIDRLDREETRLVMKLVKMTANFPNTIFVLCCDREKVAEKLNSEGSGEEYLKKIIQVSFTLPKPDEEGLKRIIFSDLEATIQDIYGQVKIEGNDERRWSTFLYKGFLSHFKTIRDIKRYISSLRLNWSLVHSSDVNQIDFLVIEMIRVFYPDVYSFIAGNKRLFISANGFAAEDKEKVIKNAFDEILEKITPTAKNSVSDILKELFPKLENNNYSDDSELRWRQEKRICASERFGFYLQLGVPDGSVSEVEVEEIIQSLNELGKFTEILKSLKEDKKLQIVLSKLLDKVHSLSETQIVQAISDLWSIDSEFFEERTEMFSFDDVSTQIYRISFFGLKALPNESRYEKTIALIAGSPSVRVPLRIVAKSIAEQPKSYNEYKIFSEEENTSLKGRMLEKLDAFAKNGTLQNEPEFIRILYQWKTFDGDAGKKVEEYIKSLTSTNEGLMVFLEACVTQVLSSNGDYKKISPKTIEGIYSLEEIKKKIEALSPEYVAQLSDKSSEALNLFKNPRTDDIFDEN
jgi:predicted KAP-like P-loop ATPase